jgi:putative pyruvate formate lyase activating enzyme
LSWYLEVAENRCPAKFRIAATIGSQLDPAASSEDALWAELDRLTPVFLARRQAIRAGAPLPPAADGSSLLELCRELAYRMLAHCNFCPWDCRVDRLAGTKLGACKLASGTRVSSHFHHTGEELFYRGIQGSGTIFFTSCNMRCAFCQNGDISTDKDNGEETDARTLATMAWTLRREGCHNINWVGGEAVIHLHTIVDAIALLGRDFKPTAMELKQARQTKADRFFWFDEMPDQAVYDGKFNAPMLWNSNFFMTLESMKILRLLTDVWLPDFKFGPGRCAMTLAKTPWYWETVTRNLALIAEWGEDLSIRHLVMPNHVACCTYPVLEWIAQRMPSAPVNVMAQFRPDNFCDSASTKYRSKYEEIARRPTSMELNDSWRRARELGLHFEASTFDRPDPFGPPPAEQLSTKTIRSELLHAPHPPRRCAPRHPLPARGERVTPSEREVPGEVPRYD